MDASRFPDLDAPVVDQDPRLRTRTMPMRVLVLGYPRTGTSSIQQALEHLGLGPCYHMRTCINQRPRDCSLWLEALKAKYDGIGSFASKDFDHLLGDCSSACDLPVIAFGPELIRAYPSAKVILTMRSVDSWHKSCANTLERARYYWLHGILEYIDWMTALVHPMRRKIWQCLFRDDFGRFGRAAMQAHYDEIRQVASQENRELLEFDNSEGWEPLCTFLGVDIPKTTYPHMNEGGDWIVKMQLRAWRRLGAAVETFLMRCLPVAGLSGALWYFWSSP